MRLKRKATAGGTAALALGLLVSSASAETTYTNERFGTSVTFPDELFSRRMDPPANGDGMTFLSADGASLAIYGGNNALALNPQDIIDEAKGRTQPGYELTYSRAGADWVVTSGFEDGLVFYNRLEFGADDVLHGLLIKYPPALKAKYDPLIGPIAGSLKGP